MWMDRNITGGKRLPRLQYTVKRQRVKRSPRLINSDQIVGLAVFPMRTGASNPTARLPSHRMCGWWGLFRLVPHVFVPRGPWPLTLPDPRPANRTLGLTGRQNNNGLGRRNRGLSSLSPFRTWILCRTSLDRFSSLIQSRPHRPGKPVKQNQAQQRKCSKRTHHQNRFGSVRICQTGSPAPTGSSYPYRLIAIQLHPTLVGPLLSPESPAIVFWFGSCFWLWLWLGALHQSERSIFVSAAGLLDAFFAP